MLDDAFRYPLASDDRVSTLLVGGVLTALPFLASLSVLIVGPPGLIALLLALPFTLVAQGYLLEVLRSAANGERAAPSFTDWGGLFVNGLKLFVVSLLYGLVLVVPFVVVGVVLGAFSVSGGAGTGGGMGPGMGPGGMGPAGPTGGNLALALVPLLVFALFALVSLAVAYVLPAALTNLALRGSLRAAFDVGTIRQVVFTTDYLVAVVLGLVINSVLGTIASGLFVLLVGVPLLFYVQVVSYYCFGRGFADARESMRVASERV